ncbi:19992_t:CDS:2 [Cetraspora pellucida]|uniref:19992_t:CDS:1 n=1 Tax=Cetraspora pellucida TaxID=1433469 RepID=A0A9N9DFG9_9GLOM|nr:19992_t:CDS:2 [Cetraspora pellucida]
MPSHVSLIVLIVAKDDKTSHTQGLAKYQSDKDVFQFVRWKYFHPFNKPRLDFSPGNILFFSGKFVIEEENEYIMVAYASIIDVGASDNGFKADEIPLCIPHFMSPMKVNNNPKIHNDNVYFGAQCRVYNAFTAHNVHMDLIVFYPAQATRFEKPDIIALEATDIDYLSSSDINFGNFETSSSNAASSLSDLSSIAGEFRSVTSQTPKKCQRSVFVSSSALNSLDLTTENVEEGWFENISEERQDDIDEQNDNDNEESEKEQEIKKKKPRRTKWEV